MELITGETIWTTHEGDRIPLKDLSDTHLANILDFARSFPVSAPIVHFLVGEAARRKLKFAFIERAQIPYKNSQGKWEIWSHDLGAFLELQD